MITSPFMLENPPVVRGLPSCHDQITITFAIVASNGVLVGNAAFSRLIHVPQVRLIPGVALSLLQLTEQETVPILVFISYVAVEALHLEFRPVSI